MNTGRARDEESKDSARPCAADADRPYESADASREVASQWPRRQRRVRRFVRRWAASLLIATVGLSQPTTTHAGIFGEDTAVLSAILSQNIAQLAQMVQTVSNLQMQIRQLTTVIQQGSTMLQTVKDPQSVLRLLRLTQSMLRKEGAIERDINLLHFKMKQIHDDQEDVFPSMDRVPSSEFQAKARKWNSALKESSSVAMRAQTSVESLESRLDHATQLQQDSEAAEGVVGQLQLVVKALALLHTDLSAIEQNLAYGERVTATMAGVQAAEEDRASEDSRRMLQNYTARGTTSRRLETLP
jgi:P-type conjugative transfer protein TrbJ